MTGKAPARRKKGEIPPWVHFTWDGRIKIDLNAKMRDPGVRAELEKMRRLMADIRAAEKERSG